VPEFTPDERARLLAHKPDFFGLNFYTATYVESDGTETGYKQTPIGLDGATLIGERGQSEWLHVVPWYAYACVCCVCVLCGRWCVDLAQGAGGAQQRLHTLRNFCFAKTNQTHYQTK
jgi:hypothetical protein